MQRRNKDGVIYVDSAYPVLTCLKLSGVTSLSYLIAKSVKVLQ